MRDFQKSVPRNLLIASMLHRVNYIEQAGTGIERIKEALANHKKKVKLDIQYSDDSMFYSIIFNKKDPVKTTQKILDLIDKNPSITRKELSKEIGNITPDGVKYHLDQLKKQGLLKRIGAAKGGHWKVIKK